MVNNVGLCLLISIMSQRWPMWNISLENRGLRFLQKCVTPPSRGYNIYIYVTRKLNEYGVQWYQDLIGNLMRVVEIGNIYILLEVSLMWNHLALTREGHLVQVLHIFGCLNIHKKTRFMFYCSHPRISCNIFKKHEWFDSYRDTKDAIPPNTPEARGHKFSISMFVDAEPAGDKPTRRSQTGVLIFMNTSLIHEYSKRKATFETITFGSYLCATKTYMDMVDDLRYNIWMFGVPTDRSANVVYNDKAFYKNTITPESVLKEK